MTLEITGKSFVKMANSIGFVENPFNLDMWILGNSFIQMAPKGSLVLRTVVKIAQSWDRMKSVHLAKKVTKITFGRQDKVFISRNQSHVNQLMMSFS